MTIQTSKPFESLISEEALPKLGDSKEFEFLLPYQVEGTIQTLLYRWRWKYTGTQEAVDVANSRDGYTERRKHELQSFERHVLQDLRSRGERLYWVEGQRVAVRGKIAS